MDLSMEVVDGIISLTFEGYYLRMISNILCGFAIGWFVFKR
jgi:hypothetical protein